MSFIVAILGASLAGSVHCAAMCGGFVCVYSGGCGPRDSRMRAHAAYNGARLAAYLLLGAVAGTIGAGIDAAGVLIGIGRAAAILAGAAMVFWGGRELLRAAGVGGGMASWGSRSGREARGSLARRFLGCVLASRDQTAIGRAAAIGFLTAMLPCGWLYAFVASAAATGRPLGGAAVMLAFWAGTVPMLLAVGMGAHRLFGAVGRRMPVVGAAVLMVLGLLSIAGRARPPVPERAAVTHAGH